MASELDTYLKKVYENLRTMYNDRIAKDTVDALREVLSEDLLKALQQLQSGEQKPPSVPIDTVPGGGSGSGKGSGSDQGGQGGGSGAGSGDRSEKREGYDKKVKPESDYSKQKPESRNKKRRLSPRDEELSKALLKKFFKKTLSKGYKQKIVREMPEEEIFKAKTAGGGEESVTVTYAPDGDYEELEDLYSKVEDLKSGLIEHLKKLKTGREERRLRESPIGARLNMRAVNRTIIEMHGNKKHGNKQPKKKIYFKKSEPGRRNAFYFLIDVSGSTGRSGVIYEEKKALLVLANALDMLEDKFNIYAFGGKYIYKVKEELNSEINDDIDLKIAGLRAGGGTPLGMAVRYLNDNVLPRVVPRDEDSYLVIISDGLPDNVEDSKAAIKEVQERGVKVIFIFVNREHNKTIDELGEQADFYVKITKDIEELPEKLADLYTELKFGK